MFHIHSNVTVDYVHLCAHNLACYFAAFIRFFSICSCLKFISVSESAATAAVREAIIATFLYCYCDDYKSMPLLKALCKQVLFFPIKQKAWLPVHSDRNL